MNDFTKEELEHVHEIFIEVCRQWKEPDSTYLLKNKIKMMIDNYCEHEWSCWDDEHNTRECMKCSERRKGEIL